MKISITRIGNSKGIIIPARLLKELDLSDEVSLEVEDDTLVISRIDNPRKGWKEAFENGNAGDEEPLLVDFENNFDHEEWTW